VLKPFCRTSLHKSESSVLAARPVKTKPVIMSEVPRSKAASLSAAAGRRMTGSEREQHCILRKGPIRSGIPAQPSPLHSSRQSHASHRAVGRSCAARLSGTRRQRPQRVTIKQAAARQHRAASRIEVKIKRVALPRQPRIGGGFFGVRCDAKHDASNREYRSCGSNRPIHRARAYGSSAADGSLAPAPPPARYTKTTRSDPQTRHACSSPAIRDDK
jgi:hypothetical protein